MIGYEPVELRGRNAADFIHGDDLERTREEMRLARHGHHMRNFDTRYIHRDGHTVAIAWTGVFSEQAQRFYFIGRDMTERKIVEAALRESEQLARGIVNDALDAIIQIDERGNVIEWNPRAEQIFGWSRQEAVGQPVASLYMPAGYRPRYLEMNERLHQVDIAADRFDFAGLRKDGTKVKLEVSMTGVRRRDGNVFNLFLRDITEKLAAEEQLRQAQKMEAVGQLTGGIAHDFNNMLTVITGTIEILEEGVADRPELMAIAKLISQAADRGAELTKHLLAFARKQPLNPRKTEINTLVVDTAKMLRPMLGEQVEIESVLRNDVWAAVVDTTQLTTAIVNLAVNARDAMPGGGKLTIETKNVVLDETSALNRDVVPGNYVMIAVSDTGTGIPAAMLDKIFEPFFSTKEVGKGTGLGLSMVYGFVKQSGGHIKVYSEEGHGTSFKIYLPSTSDLTDQSTPAAPASMRGGSETVMVVEDDALVRNYVTQQLKSLGYQTVCAADANEALRLVDSGTEFELLFTDVIMPGSMNGRQLADELVKRRPSVRVLFTSGYTEDAVVHHGKLDPGVLLLPKPYRKSDLDRMVREALSTSGRYGRAAVAG
jgi:PAS domain S-box-containing protein